MFATNSINPITQAEVAFRADRARREIGGSRRRRIQLPYWGDKSEVTSTRAE